MIITKHTYKPNIIDITQVNFLSFTTKNGHGTIYFKSDTPIVIGHATDTQVPYGKYELAFMDSNNFDMLESIYFTGEDKDDKHLIQKCHWAVDDPKSATEFGIDGFIISFYMNHYHMDNIKENITIKY